MGTHRSRIGAMRPRYVLKVFRQNISYLGGTGLEDVQVHQQRRKPCVVCRSIGSAARSYPATQQQEQEYGREPRLARCGRCTQWLQFGAGNHVWGSAGQTPSHR